MALPYEVSHIDPCLSNYEDETSIPGTHQHLLLGGHLDFSQGQHITFTSNGMGGNAAVAPLPSAYNRHSSPFAQLSSTSSSAPGESEYGLEHPSTPQDVSTAQHDWFTHGQHIALTGLASPYIKPEQVLYYHEQMPSYHEEKPDLCFRGLSMSSMSSTYDLDIRSQPRQLHVPRTMSPAEMSQSIQEVVRPSDSYPSPGTEEDEETSADALQTRDDNDDDEDYNPHESHKRSDSTEPRPSRHQKRSGTAQSLAPYKKVKTSPMANDRFTCQECGGVAFKDNTGLQKHIKQLHTRPFTCVFHFAGCKSTFATKNEWKRHVSSQHLLLNYWLCQQDACAKLSNTSASSTKPTGTSRHRATNVKPGPLPCTLGLPDGAIFNRKDLYTQHLRRMHSPPQVKKQVKSKKPAPEWEDRIRGHQKDAHKLRCQLPEYMKCPAPGCTFEAVGSNAWDDRMEHVAKHLEKAANGQENPIEFGGDNDPSLMAWVLRPDVAVVKVVGSGTWALHNPLKPDQDGSARVSQASQASQSSTDSDADYEGEEDAPCEDE